MTNKQFIATVEKIIFGKTLPIVKYRNNGGIVYFKHVTKDQFNQLFENVKLDPDMTQNESPSMGAFKDFINKYPHFRVSGYIVSPERNDTRVSVDGINHDNTPITDAEKIAFAKEFHDADDFDIDNGTAWYD